MDAQGHAVATAAAAARMSDAAAAGPVVGLHPRSLSRCRARASRTPWVLRQNYLRDRYEMDRGDVAKDMEFTAPVRVPATAVSAPTPP